MVETPPKIEVRIALADADLERLLVVGSDLEWLLALPRDRLLTHTEVRLAAGVLRRLVVDDQIQQLWKTIEKPERARLTVVAPNLDEALNQWPEGGVIAAWAGGATTAGLKTGRFAHHAGFILGRVPEATWKRYGSPERYFEAVGPPPSHVLPRRMSLAEWKKSTSAAIHTQPNVLVRISREAMIKYVANKKGGVHFDPRRPPPNTVAKVTDHQLQSALLDYGLLQVGHLTGPEFEVMSMARAIADSGWAEDTVNAMHGCVPEEWISGDPHELKIFTWGAGDDGTGWTTMRMDPVKRRVLWWRRVRARVSRLANRHKTSAAGGLPSVGS
jgi:hypothetical protein